MYNIFYVTFGSGHLFGFGLKYFLKFYACEERIVRQWMMKHAENRYSSIYDVDNRPSHGEKCLGAITIESNNIDQWFTSPAIDTD